MVSKKTLLLSRLTVLEYLHTLTCREKFKARDKNALIYFKEHSEVNVKFFLLEIIFSKLNITLFL